MREQKSSLKWANYYYDPTHCIPNALAPELLQGAKRDLSSGTPEEEKHKHPYLKSIEKIVSHFATYGNALGL
ncbi:MAG: hypothetical protein H2069_02390 [Legionella sp.]|nr:hypothetical protein [Legionella sp.]